MKYLIALLMVTATSALTGCSNVPDCGNEKTLAVAKELVLQNLLGDEAKNLSDQFRVELGSIRVTSHDKDPEKYSCEAEVKVFTQGKLNELFGNANDDLARLLKGELKDNEAWKIDMYGYLSRHLGKAAYGVETAVTMDVAMQVALSTSGLPEPRTLEYVSTTAQENGASRHYVKIKQIFPTAARPIIELAKFSKSYVREANKATK